MQLAVDGQESITESALPPSYARRSLKNSLQGKNFYPTPWKKRRIQDTDGWEGLWRNESGTIAVMTVKEMSGAGLGLRINF
ncbi:MAG: hypothetical protein ABSA48_05775 [Terracidiphilus sp.]|jgi:hypothetical protein